MKNEITIGIPGPWKDQTEFVQQVVSTTEGEYLFAGMTLLHVPKKDGVSLQVFERYTKLREVFEAAGRGRFSDAELDTIESHNTIVYLLFPLDLLEQQHRIQKFTALIKKLGGYAINIESTGAAYSWTKWNEIILSEDPFDLYRTFVVLLADEEHFYSCGMHHFGLPDCQISRSHPMEEAADTMNQFNFYQIMETPTLVDGHTFSLAPETPYYRLDSIKDARYSEDDSFHNPYGQWNMVTIPNKS